MMAQVARFFFLRDSDYQVIAFTVDKKYNLNPVFCGIEVIDFEDIEKKYSPEEYEMFIGVGPNKMNTIREKKYYEAKEKGYKLASCVSRYAICDSPLGENTFIGDYAVINPFVEMGNNNFFYEFSLVNCNSIIGNNCYFSPRSIVSTFAKIENNSLIGAGAIIKTSVTVAEKTLVGASCYISKNTEKNGVYGEKSSLLYGCISEKIDISLF